MKKALKNIFRAMLLSGVIVSLIGLYFCALRAGLPYQDPDIEMAISYQANMLAGEYCLKAGCITFIIGLVGLPAASLFGSR